MSQPMIPPDGGPHLPALSEGTPLNVPVESSKVVQTLFESIADNRARARLTRVGNRQAGGGSSATATPTTNAARSIARKLLERARQHATSRSQSCPSRGSLLLV